MIIGANTLKETLVQPKREYSHKCERCGVVVKGEWPCLTAKDAKNCNIASAAGVTPKLRISRQ